MKTNSFSLLLLCSVGACGAAPSDYKLPVGESGDGASVRAFVEVCALSNKGDGPALFDSVQQSDYHIRYEVVQNGKRYEAKASSFEGRRAGVCPIFVAIEDFGSEFTCQFVLISSCGDKLVGEIGPFVKSKLAEIDGVSFNAVSSAEKNSRFNDGRYHVFDIAGSSVKNQQITLTYSGRVGGSVYLSTEIEPNHNFSGVMSAEETTQKLLEEYTAE